MKNIIWSDWSQEEELTLLARMDIGLMPLFNGPFELGKCGYKLIQYMASGVIPVASPVGANLDIIDQGTTGFFANAIDDWPQAINTILNLTYVERFNIIHNGLDVVERKYSINSQACKLLDVMNLCSNNDKT
jgi:glycosyltransferase involved in cell wall biosynthesis